MLLKTRTGQPLRSPCFHRLPHYYELVRHRYFIPPFCMPVSFYGLQDSSDFSCSLQTPVRPSCQLYPGCYMTTKQVARHTLVVNTSVYAHFQHHLIALTRLQPLVQVLQLSITHLRKSSLRFSLSFTTTEVSVCCSIRWFADYPCRPSAEGHSFSYIRGCRPFSSLELRTSILTKKKGFHHLKSIHSKVPLERFKTHTERACCCGDIL